MITISFNKELLILIVFLSFVAHGIVYACAGIFLRDVEKSKTYGNNELIAGVINLVIAVAVLML